MKIERQWVQFVEEPQTAARELVSAMYARGFYDHERWPSPHLPRILGSCGIDHAADPDKRGSMKLRRRKYR